MEYRGNHPLSGVYGLYKKEECAAEIVFERGRFAKIYAIHKKALLPPYFTDKDTFTDESYNLQLGQFFSARVLPQKNPYYHTALSLQYGRYISLFDDYWLKVDELGYQKLHEYQLSTDAFACRVLMQSQLSNGYSPNLALPYEGLALFDVRGDRKLLLQEYSKDLAVKKKQKNIHYSLEIIRDIPFICVPLQQGNYFPLNAVTPVYTDKKLISVLKDRGMDFDEETFDRKSAMIYMINDATGVLRYL